MRGWPPALRRLIGELSRLPGIGEKTAGRLALYILDQDPSFASDLSSALLAVKTEIRRCTRCHGLSEGELCDICSDTTRDSSLLCVVQSVADQLAIERTGEFHAQYHVLQGLIRPLDGIGPESIGLPRVVERVRSEGIREVLIATSASVEGEATSMYLRRLLEREPVAISRIARGLPLGSEVEYADRATLGRALASREQLGSGDGQDRH